jgi:hypothetical protein
MKTRSGTKYEVKGITYEEGKLFKIVDISEKKTKEMNTENIKKTEVTENQFRIYKTIRKSGKTNMFDINNVISLSDGILDRPTIIKIMTNYTDLSKIYK